MNNFITNFGEDTSLATRLKKLIPVCVDLKFLIGFFYFSGWREIYTNLQNNSQTSLKILVGLQVDKHLSKMVELDNIEDGLSNEEQFTHFVQSLGNAVNNAEMDNEEFYGQVEFFLDMLEQGRLIIKKTRHPNHAKLYLFVLNDEINKGLNIAGEFITGSSNLTTAGLRGQQEFNVEIRDYGFAEANQYYEDLWAEAIPISEAPNGKQIITHFLRNKAQSSLVTPFEAYAFILKTYLELQESKKTNAYLDRILEENGFDRYAYQIDAVNQALNVIETYNGVLIADVTGLGKSVIASLVANQLGKRGLILCPPGLIGSKKDGTGWWEYWSKFQLYDWDIESSGNMEAVAESMVNINLGYEVVIVDEAARFRNQDTADYEALTEICRGKKVILLTATPFNNSPADIFSLLKLFIVPGLSGITIESDLEGRFNSYNYRFRNLSNILKNHHSLDLVKREKAEKTYTKMFGLQPPIDVEIVKQNAAIMARDIKNVITPIIIRRNRLDLKTDFQYKKEVDNLSEVRDPEELFFSLSPAQSRFYDQIITGYFGETGLFKGAIYKPFEYEGAAPQANQKVKKLSEEENRALQQQRNLFEFMRRLLVKRFESSFGAFEKSVERFLRAHRMVKSFIESSGKYVLDRKVIDAIYNDEDGADDFTTIMIEKALEEFRKNSVGKTAPKHTKIYEVNSFARKDEFLKAIDDDIALFEMLQDEINQLDLVNSDPKCTAVMETVKGVLARESNPKRKVILFSEYTDTVKHLLPFFEKEFGSRVLFCAGSITKKFAEDLEANFNAKHKNPRDDYDILISSDKLSEGYNLNRAGLIINYDIPWNPTRVIQRVGRINRIGTKVFNELLIYNFFPTELGATIVKSREIASQKMFLIHNALGEDSKIFGADEEPTASGLFKKISSNPEEDEELSVSTLVRNEFKEIKENYPDTIERVNDFPNRTKTSKLFGEDHTVVLRKKGMALFSLVGKVEKNTVKIEELSFEHILPLTRCEFDTKRQNINHTFWKTYETIKTFSPQHKSRSTDISIETKAINSLKSLLKFKRDELNQPIVSFIDTLVKDIKRYKTLSKHTLRRLVLKEKAVEDPYPLLIEEIQMLRRKLGSDYLDKILSRVSDIEDDVIIAVHNQKSIE
ncbi:MAG: helicase [Bacteroidetes bacterium]|nr:helicase [Bacteroidota bacterium]